MLIPLGYHCNISILNQQLQIKKETGVFEWFVSKNLQNITDIINTLTTDPTLNIVYENTTHVYLLNTNCVSTHYKLDEYKAIFKRRYNRFIDIINKEECVYFVRLNIIDEITTKPEIELFIESIKKIHPNIKIVFLLIDTIRSTSDFNSIHIDIKNVILHHKYLHETDVNNPTMRTNYKKILEEIGYNINETNTNQFNEMS